MNAAQTVAAALTPLATTAILVVYGRKASHRIRRIVDNGQLTDRFPPDMPGNSPLPLDEQAEMAMAVLTPDDIHLPAEEAQR